ncbi:MAG: ribosomal protein S18-alanine N-acetyltransferase [Acetatifactor sp.]|nr:ribosomal protein S18-alanine N-acetyltransferase [Acetatifactor sp.]
MKPLIRPLRAEDAPTLAQIEQKIFSMPWSEHAFLELLECSYHLYLAAEWEGMLVGCAGLTVLDNEGDIEKVMVREDFRRRGIAGSMLRELIAAGERLGITEFTLEVRAGNAPAIRLYEKFGFVSEGIRPGFYEKPAEDAVIMWRRQ